MRLLIVSTIDPVETAIFPLDNSIPMHNHLSKYKSPPSFFKFPIRSHRGLADMD